MKVSSRFFVPAALVLTGLVMGLVGLTSRLGLRGGFSFLDLNMIHVVEPGTFALMVGASSVKTQNAKLKVVVK